MGDERKNPMYNGQDLPPVFTALYKARKTTVVRPFAEGMETLCAVEDEAEFTPDELFARAWHNAEDFAPSHRIVLHSIQSLKEIRDSASPAPITPMQDRDSRMHEVVLLQYVTNSIRRSLRENPVPDFDRVPTELVEYVITAATEYFYQEFTDRYPVDTISVPNFKPTMDWVNRYVQTELSRLAHDSENNIQFWQSAKNNSRKGFGLFRFYHNVKYFIQGMYDCKDPEILLEFPQLVYFLNGNSRSYVDMPHVYRDLFMREENILPPADHALSAALQYLMSTNISVWERAKLLALLNDNRVMPPYGKALVWLRNEVRTNPAVHIEMTPFNSRRERRAGNKGKNPNSQSEPDNSQGAAAAELPRPAELPIRSYLKGQPDEKATAVLMRILPYIPSGQENLIVDYFMGAGIFRGQIALTDEITTVLRRLQDNVLNAAEEMDAETKQLLKSILRI